MMKNILMLFVLIMFSECSYAVFTTGNDLAKEMVEYEKKENNDLVGIFLGGHYTGYVDGITAVTAGLMWCNPGNVTPGQIFKIVSKYLNNNPENLHFSADSLVVQALKEAFPCKK
jgi:hypothetical protein